MEHVRQVLVWSSERGQNLYARLEKLHVQPHRPGEHCPGCRLARQMEQQMASAVGRRPAESKRSH